MQHATPTVVDHPNAPVPPKKADSPTNSHLLPSLVPVIVCGDFNDTEDSSAVAAVRGASLGLRSCWDDAMIGRPPDERFSTWKFRAAGEKLAVIDYVW